MYNDNGAAMQTKHVDVARDKIGTGKRKLAGRLVSK